jgi:hypothetical protein
MSDQEKEEKETIEEVQEVAQEEVSESKEEQEEVSESKEKQEEISEYKEKQEEDIKDDPIEDIFITEDDTFDITIQWYKFGGKVLVESEDPDFDEEYKGINSFNVTFKYPSQGDYEIIMSSATYRSPDDINVADIVKMEITRMVTLVRGWSLDQKMERMVELDPNIIKAMLRKVRDVIGMKGIL